MRSLVVLVLLCLAVSGCSVPGADPGEEPVVEPPPDHRMPLPYEEPVAPRGHVEVRWPGGAWGTTLRADETTVVLADGPLTKLEAPPVRHFEARFVGEPGNDSAWSARWTAWDLYGRGGGPRFVEDLHAVQTFPAPVGRTEVTLEFSSRDGVRHQFGGSAVVVVAHAWEVHGTVQPLPAQVPGAPDVRHEVRVPTTGRWGNLLLSTEAEREPPATGRDLRLGYRAQGDERCTEAPPAGFVDHTDHLMQVHVHELLRTVQVFVGNPSGWCAGSLGGPANAEPIDYVLRVELTTGDTGLDVLY